MEKTEQIFVPQADNFKKKAIRENAFFEENLVDYAIDEAIINIFTQKDAETYEAIPIKKNAEIIYFVACAVSPVFQMLPQLQKKIGFKIIVLLADPDNLKTALQHYYKITARRQRKENIEIDSPFRRKIISILNNAIENKASDVHLLPIENELIKIQFRINGHLVDMSTEYEIDSIYASNVSVIIKDLDSSNQAKVEDSLNINQGSFEMEYHGEKVNIRISTAPCMYGEKIVLRLLPKNTKRKSLAELGYTQEDLKVIRKALLTHSTGLYIMSGPTGSGKTTSMYSQIDENLTYLKEERNIVTVEDPVEIYEPHFCQMQISHVDLLKKSAEDIFEGILRQDPDIILYNEIRNSIDAQVAMRAAMSGHQTFTTVHAKNVVTTLLRLMDLDVDRATLLEQLNLIVSQRLVGILCPKCSKKHKLTKQEEAYLDKEDLEILIEGSGLKEQATEEEYKKCECQSGYVKRIAIAEYIHFDNELRDVFLNKELSFNSIYKFLKSKGYKSMWEKALALVANGQCDLKEIYRDIGK